MIENDISDFGPKKPRSIPAKGPEVVKKVEPAFIPPEEVAKTEIKDLPPVETVALSSTPLPKTSRLKRIFHLKLTKKNKIIGAAVLGVLLIGIGALSYWHFSSHPVAKKIVTKPVIAKPVVPTIVASTLSGLPVAPSVNNNPVTGVMIENEIDARPQSGLDQAGVVFEALAEGGITRFLALYQDTTPSYIGPIRSARPYYVSWCLGFDCDYAHVGGSPDALTDITSWGVKDLNEFYNGGSYVRINTRYAPHNVYSSIATLNSLEASKGYNTPKFQGFPRKVAAPVKTPTTSTIAMNLGATDYNVSYTYSATNNSYLRNQAGQPMMNIDASGTQVQISPKVVIAIIVPFSQGALDASNAYYSNYTTVGSGAAYIFQDGAVTVGNWQKTSNNSQITFTDTNNKTIPLNPGQTWITALTTSGDLTYQ